MTEHDEQAPGPASQLDLAALRGTLNELIGKVEAGTYRKDDTHILADLRYLRDRALAPHVTAQVGDVAALRALSEAATVGPWTAATAPNKDSTETAAEYHQNLLTNQGRDLWVCWTRDGSTDVDYVVPAVSGDGPRSEANAAFIAAAVNHVRAALAAPVTAQVEQRDAEIARLRARVHEAVDECQRRYAPYQKQVEQWRAYSAFWQRYFEGMGEDTYWTHTSQAARTVFLNLTAERDAALARVDTARRDALAPVLALFSGGPDTPCRTTWIKAPDYPNSPPVECVEVPMVDLRAALDAARAAVESPDQPERGPLRIDGVGMPYAEGPAPDQPTPAEDR